MLDLSVRCALWIRLQNLKKDDVIAISTNDQMNAFIPIFGCFYSGKVLSTWYQGLDQGQTFVKSPITKPRTKLDENFVTETFDQYMNISKPRLIFTDRANIEIVKTSLQKQNLQTKIVCFEEHENCEYLWHILEPENPVKIDEFKCDDQVGPHDTALIGFSSGTTGKFKLIEFSHISCIAELHESSNNIIKGHVCWYQFKMGLNAGIWPLLRSIELPESILVHDVFDPEEIGKNVEKYKVRGNVEI